MSQRNPSFQLIQTLRKSPAVFRRRFHLWPNRTDTLSHGDPLYKVLYLGTEKIYSLDLEQAQGAIGLLLQQWAPEAPEKLCREHALVLRRHYIEVKEIATGRQLAKTYLRDIAFCAADTKHPNVFLYICKQQGQQLKLQCRVFWCTSADRAKDITACLARSFQTALNDWQVSETNHMEEGEGSSEVDGMSVNTSLHPNTSSALSGDLRTGRWWRRRGVASPCPLRAMRKERTGRTTTISNDGTQSTIDI